MRSGGAQGFRVQGRGATSFFDTSCRGQVLRGQMTKKHTLNDQQPWSKPRLSPLHPHLNKSSSPRDAHTVYLKGLCRPVWCRVHLCQGGMTQESENPTRLKLLGLGGMHMNVHTRKVATQDTSLARLSVKMALVMFSHTLLMPRCLRLVLTVPVRFSGYLHVAEWLWLVWFDIHGLGNAASRSDHSQVC